jgi:predicted small secreted protein
MTRRTSLKHLLIFAVLASLALSISACRTMEGLGDDVSRLGNKISSKAREKASN